MKSFKELITGLEEARLFASYQDAAAAAAPGQKPKLDSASNKYILVREETISEAQVSTKKYSWGTMKTIHHGSDFSIPLHPEHHKAIAKLKDEQEHNFKTEDGKHWTARRKGDDVHFQGANNGGTTKVSHSTMAEAVETTREFHLRQASYHQKQGNAEKAKHHTTQANDWKVKKAHDDTKRAEADIQAKYRREETEQLDEISLDTMKSAKDKLQDRAYDAHMDDNKYAARHYAGRAVSMKKKIAQKERNLTKEEVQELEEGGQSYGSESSVSLKDKNKFTPGKAGSGTGTNPFKTPYKPHKPTNVPAGAVTKSVKEEVELEEANHREFASQGKMHPDMAKHMKTGEHMDYYEPKTGDKVHGKVMKNDGKEVHVKQSHDSYDPKKVGSVHKFKVSSQLDEVLTPSMGAGEYVKDFQKSDAPQFSGKGKEKRRVMAIAAYLQAKRDVKEAYDDNRRGFGKRPREDDEYHVPDPEVKKNKVKKEEFEEQVQKADIPAYLRKAKGEKPLELKDLKRKDTISDAENLAKNRGVKEQQEGNMKSYKEFVTEIKMSDLPRRSIKGSSYGAQYDDPEGADDADDKKPAKAADAPKRGRGRPAGSTSGARQQGSAKQSKSGVDYTGYKLHLPNSNK